MKELKTITEYQLLYLATAELMNRIEHEKARNEKAKKEYGRDNRVCQSRLKMYNEQLEEIHERTLEIESSAE